MLIEFSVSNFRSIRERQTLSMVAAPKLRKRENVFTPDVDGEKLPGLLKVAAIYGPNASGKSNLLHAMNVVSLMTYAPTGNETIAVAPFRFDAALQDKPSVFEWNFIAGGTRYQFEFSALSTRIIQEKLTAYPKGRESLLYSRSYLADSGDEYEFGPNFEANPVVRDAWQKMTGPRTLFIAQAVANSSEDLTQLKIPYTWLKHGPFVITDGMSAMARHSQNTLKNNAQLANEIADFLREVDVPVSHVKIEPFVSSFAIGLASPYISERVALQDMQKPADKMIFTHQTMLGQADFDFNEESKGTQGLLGFWLPWSMLGHSSSPFSILIVDELDSSLHPEIVANLIKKYLSLGRNAQLIFTTHDTHLMDTKILRRDQFWLTERDRNGATQLRSIHEFQGRESEDIEKRYYEGRYRGLPVLRTN